MQYSIEVKKERSFDVCVFGGGPAGFAAAAAAGRCGAHTALVEKYGILGGAMTVGGIPLPGLFHAPGRQVISGIGWELIERLEKRGWAIPPKAPYDGPHPSIHVKVNGFEAACEMDTICREAGVELLLHRQAFAVYTEERKVKTVLLTGADGVTAIHAKVFIDCTGDGNLAYQAGAAYEKDENLQPGSLSVVFDGIEPEKIDVEAANKRYAKAVEEGRLLHTDVWSGQCTAIWGGMGSNLNHVYPIDGGDSESRSEAEVRARASVRRLVDWMRAEIPGCEHARVSFCCPETWVRESRRILGRKYITGTDYVSGLVPEDSVCYSFYDIDMHSAGKQALLIQKVDHRHLPGIPYGALVVRDFDNLLTAGRCISGDHEAHAAYRVQACCMATGQAAGTAAALSSQKDVPVWQLPIGELKEVLRTQGVIVP